MLIELAKALSGEIQLSSKLGQWILTASRLLDARVVDLQYPQIRLGDPADAAHYPAVAEGGPTVGWVFVNGNWVYIESPLLTDRDPTQNVIVGIAWAPLGDEPTKTVRWQGDFGFESVGKDVTVIDATLTADASAGGALRYQHTSILVKPSDLAAFPNADEIHMRLQLVTSGNDPVNPPGLHHIAVIQALR